jgi:predicted  nucleic acid-binding Zn-ribbon protein
VAQIQFLNNSRDTEVQDLVEEAGLNLGSADGSFITVKDQAVEARHALIYSVKGQFYLKPESVAAKCFVNFRPLPPEGGAIGDRDILMFGRTLAKFWRGTAPAGGSGGGGAPDPKVAKERDDLRAQVATLEKQVRESSAGASAAAQAQIDAARREKDEVSKQLDVAKRDADRLKGEKDAVDKAKRDAEKARDEERESGKKTREKLESELAESRANGASLQKEIDGQKPVLEQKDKELDAVRKALEALRTADAQAKRDRRGALREGSDLAKALGAINVPDSLRDRIAAAVRDEVDREVLARDGASVPLRGLHCPACDHDLEADLGALKARRKQMDALRALGIANLSSDDVKALASKVRSQTVKA